MESQRRLLPTSRFGVTSGVGGPFQLRSNVYSLQTAIEGASSSAFVPTVSALDRYTINKHFPSAIEVDAKGNPSTQT